MTGFPGGHPFAGEDAWGRFAWVRLADDAREVGFLVVDRTGAKDVAEDRHVDPGGHPGDLAAARRPGRSTPSARRPTPAPDDLVVIHYRRPDGDYAGWGLHAWEGTATKPGLGRAAEPGRLGRVRRGVPGAGPAGRHRAAVRAAPRRHQGPARRPAPRPDRGPRGVAGGRHRGARTARICGRSVRSSTRPGPWPSSSTAPPIAAAGRARRPGRRFRPGRVGRRRAAPGRRRADRRAHHAHR